MLNNTLFVWVIKDSAHVVTQNNTDHSLVQQQTQEKYKHLLNDFSELLYLIWHSPFIHSFCHLIVHKYISVFIIYLHQEMVQ